MIVLSFSTVNASSPYHWVSFTLLALIWIESPKQINNVSSFMKSISHSAVNSTLTFNSTVSF